MRMSAAESCVEKLEIWAMSEDADNRGRRNKESTYIRLQKMADKLLSTVEHIHSMQSKIYPDRTDGVIRSHSNASAVSELGKITLTADSPEALMAALASIQSAASSTSAIHEVKSESTDNTESGKNNVDSQKAESSDIIPKISAEVKPKRQEKRERVDWRNLIEQYSVAINNLRKESFETSGADVCADYLKRWMDALKVGFKRKRDAGRIRYGADKISDAIPRFILVITQYIQDGNLSEFEDDFKRWELRANGLDNDATPDMMSHGLPYIVAHMSDADNIEKYSGNDLANAVYREFLDGSLRTVSRVKYGQGHYEYLSASAISTLKTSAA